MHVDFIQVDVTQLIVQSGLDITDDQLVRCLEYDPETNTTSLITALKGNCGGPSIHFVRLRDWLLDHPSIDPGVRFDPNAPPPSFDFPKGPASAHQKQLSELQEATSRGLFAAKLPWVRLDATEFERLIFSLVSAEPGYENPLWLMQTNAPDRGRDLSVERIMVDPLGGTRRCRVIIQCKHWQHRSISTSDIATLKEQMSLWEPPRVDVHIIATSGRFTSDAVAAIERHNQSDTALRIEMWPDSHIERLVAARPALRAAFGLK
jgi:Restriction endonuclease